MKKLIFTFLLLLGLHPTFAQKSEIDSLKYQLNIAKHDTSRALILAQISYDIRNSNIDTSLLYAQKALNLAQKIKFSKAEIRALNNLGFYYRVTGDLPKALNYQITALEIAEKSGYLYDIAVTSYLIGNIYLDLKDYDKAINNYQNRALKIFERLGNKERQRAVWLNIAVGYRLNNQQQLSFNALQKVRALIDNTTPKENIAFYFSELGSTQVALGNHQIGLETQKKAAGIYQDMNNLRRLSTVYNAIALDFDKLNQVDSSSFYAQKGLLTAESVSFKREILIASKLLAKNFGSSMI